MYRVYLSSRIQHRVKLNDFLMCQEYHTLRWDLNLTRSLGLPLQTVLNDYLERTRTLIIVVIMAMALPIPITSQVSVVLTLSSSFTQSAAAAPVLCRSRVQRPPTTASRGWCRINSLGRLSAWRLTIETGHGQCKWSTLIISVMLWSQFPLRLSEYGVDTPFRSNLVLAMSGSELDLLSIVDHWHIMINHSIWLPLVHWR